jgi:aspartate/methionine/tyrosine aminotransferase
MNKLAEELNSILTKNSSTLYGMLSDYGKRIYFPKGIISQSGEAKKKAKKFNATIGIAKGEKGPLFLESIHESFNDSIDPQNLYPYAPSSGREDLKELWQKRQLIKNPLLGKANLHQPVVTSGLTHGLSLLGDLFLNKGDIVLTPEKLWGNYKLMWDAKNQATLKTYPLYGEDKKGFNLQGFKQALEAHKGQKIFTVLNFPNNPTGYSPTEEEAQEIKKVLLEAAEQGSQLIVICDDAYFGMNYEKNCFSQSLFGLIHDLHENLLAVKIDGPTKELFVWGFRVGFLTFGTKGATPEVYEALTKKVGGAIRGGISNVTNVGQSLLVRALKNETLESQIEEKVSLLKERYFEVKENVTLEKYSDFWNTYPFNSGYFMCIQLKGVKAEDLRIHLLNEYEIGTIALGEHDLRIAFSSLQKGDIKEFFECVAKGIQDLRN